MTSLLWLWLERGPLSPNLPPLEQAPLATRRQGRAGAPPALRAPARAGACLQLAALLCCQLPAAAATALVLYIYLALGVACRAPRAQRRGGFRGETPLRGADTPLGGADTPLRGAETPLRGAAETRRPLRGAETPLRGAETPLRGAETPLRGAACHVKSAIPVKNRTGFIFVRFALGFSSEQCRCALHPTHRNPLVHIRPVCEYPLRF
jgi:hypothetical protein